MINVLSDFFVAQNKIFIWHSFDEHIYYFFKDKFLEQQIRALNVKIQITIIKIHLPHKHFIHFAVYILKILRAKKTENQNNSNFLSAIIESCTEK